MNDEDPYVYPGSDVLRNRLGITNPAMFDQIERRLVVERAAEGIPRGLFDLDHLCWIHRHLFQDVFDWAGRIRTVEIAKGGQQFQFRHFIEAGMADVTRRFKKMQFLQGLSRDIFNAEAAHIIGNVNYVHPFWEGNGRTQFYYLEQLAEEADHPINLVLIDPSGWVNASRAAHLGVYEPMMAEMARAI